MCSRQDFKRAETELVAELAKLLSGSTAREYVLSSVTRRLQVSSDSFSRALGLPMVSRGQDQEAKASERGS